jgi:hypothetical protein
MRTCFAVLGEAGTDAEHIAKLTTYLAAGIDIVRLHTPQSVATSLTVRPSQITARTALYLCSVTLISLMRGSVTNQPK